MTILKEIHPELPVELQHFDDRELRWLWWWLVNQGAELPPENSLHPSQRIQMMGDLLGPTPRHPLGLVGNVIRAHQDALVPEETLAWITREDQRLLIWLLAIVAPSLPPPPGPKPNLFFLPTSITPERRRSEFVFTLDMAPMLMSEKLALLNSAQEQWSRAKTPDREIKWLNSKNTSQINWTWDYLRDHGKAAKIREPLTNEERYICVLAGIDLAAESHPAEKQLFLEKMKKAWAQWKYRKSGKAKKPYHLPLTVKASKQLDWLAKQTGKDRSNVLIRLIEEEYRLAEGPQIPEGEGIKS